ncbi:MAG: hypothetical protein JW969_05315 [Spirochaetales bacterium]|nr:hypothetical protein [Spirochaetales bacterium]
MKKILLVVCALIILAGPLNAQILLGTEIGYDLEFSNWTMASTQDHVMNNLVFGLFFDAIYARISADYRMFFAGTSSDGTTTSKFVDTIVSYADLTLLLKYPFDFGGWKFWPAVGARYAISLQYTSFGTDYLSSTDYSMHDLFIIGGFGFDFKVGTIMLSPSATFAYNFFASPYAEETSGWTFTDFDVEVKLGIAFPF